MRNLTKVTKLQRMNVKTVNFLRALFAVAKPKARELYRGTGKLISSQIPWQLKLKM